MSVQTMWQSNIYSPWVRLPPESVEKKGQKDLKMNAASINRAQEQKLPSAHARAGVAIGNNNLRFKVARRVGVVELLASPSARRVGEHAASSIGAGEVRVGRGRRESAASLTARGSPAGSVRLVAWDELLLPVPDGDDNDDEERRDRSATESSAVRLPWKCSKKIPC